jgi:hypothetical protein
MGSTADARAFHPYAEYTTLMAAMLSLDVDEPSHSFSCYLALGSRITKIVPFGLFGSTDILPP